MKLEVDENLGQVVQVLRASGHDVQLVPTD